MYIVKMLLSEREEREKERERERERERAWADLMPHSRKLARG